MNPIRNNLVLELHVPDFDPIKKFYAELGFEIILEDQVSASNPGYLTIARRDALGDTMLNFYGGDERIYNQSYFRTFPRNTVRGYGTEITIPTNDIDAIYEKVHSSIPDNIVRELQLLKDDHIQWRDFRITDPFGFYLRFTELVNWGQ